MKIGILTFHCAINYGAVLQTYGLQETLKRMGHEVSVIDYCPDYLKRPYRLFFSERMKGHGLLDNLRMFVRECFSFPYRYIRNREFSNFAYKHFSLQDMRRVSLSYHNDLIVIGSDQVWNPYITEGMDAIYWGMDSRIKDIKHISYAASSGSTKALETIPIDKVREALKGFAAVSVRELSLAYYLNLHTSITTQVVLDPVLLVGKESFLSLIPSAKKATKPYLLLFTLAGNKEAQRIAKRIAVEKNLDFKEIVSNNEILKDPSVIKGASPESFLTYFQNASYVVSTSFHGTAFAILFHKEFNVYCDNVNIGERIQNLLQMVGLTDRMITANSQSWDSKAPSINWSDVDTRLDVKRKESIDFLKNVLEKM